MYINSPGPWSTVKEITEFLKELELIKVPNKDRQDTVDRARKQAKVLLAQRLKEEKDSPQKAA